MKWFKRQEPPPLPHLIDNRTRDLVDDIAVQVQLLRQATDELRAVIKRMNTSTGKVQNERRA